MQDLSQRTLEKIQFLEDQSFNVVEIWTCDTERQLAADLQMKEFFDNFEVSEPLEPRLIIADAAEYFDWLTSGKVKATDASFINEELVVVH